MFKWLCMIFCNIYFRSFPSFTIYFVHIYIFLWVWWKCVMKFMLTVIVIWYWLYMFYYVDNMSIMFYLCNCFLLYHNRFIVSHCFYYILQCLIICSLFSIIVYSGFSLFDNILLNLSFDNETKKIMEQCLLWRNTYIQKLISVVKGYMSKSSQIFS